MTFIQNNPDGSMTIGGTTYEPGDVPTERELWELEHPDLCPDCGENAIYDCECEDLEGEEE